MYRNFASATEHAAAVRIADDPPFSFVYGGKPFPEGFVRTGDHAFLHPATGLRVTLEVSLYGEDSSAVEWTPRFENTGAADTPVIEDIRALDWRGPMADGAWIGTLNGTQGRADDFLYREAPLAEATYASVPAWGGMKAANHLAYIRFIEENGLRFDYYWIDAGWHGPDHETEEYQNFLTEDWAYNTGDWSENRRVYPNGLKEVADAARAAGMKPLLWFHAYVGNEGVGWMKDHPEWSGPLGEPHGIGLCKRPTRVGRINVAIPEARKWLTDTIGDTLVRNGMAGYREDTCLPYAGEDAPDREGVAEIRSVEALYEIWDGYPVEWHRRMLDAWRRVRPLLCGDFFPLTGCDTATDGAVAYAFWRPDLGRGALLAFFRQDCPKDELPLALPLPAGRYRFTDDDTGEERIVPARPDGGAPFRVAAAEKPFAALWHFAVAAD